MIAYDMFDEMNRSIQDDTVRILYHVRIERAPEEAEKQQETVKITGTNRDDDSLKKTVTRKKRKIYPNDPCPCGSGKKYKQCHGRPGAGPLPDDF